MSQFFSPLPSRANRVLQFLLPFPSSPLISFILGKGSKLTRGILPAADLDELLDIGDFGRHLEGRRLTSDPFGDKIESGAGWRFSSSTSSLAEARCSSSFRRLLWDRLGFSEVETLGFTCFGR